MADAKISQLPVATTPLAGTELVPVVQGGVTVQTTVGDVLTGAVPSGTANGVLYLNGSKVVTSGSALTYNGTGFGIGISSAAGNLDVYTATTSIGYVRTANQTLKLTADDASGRVDIANAAGSPVSFTVGVTEQMRLTSTGLGIGTSSPGAKLHVEAASPTNGITQVLLASGSTGAQLQFTQSGIENWSIGQPAGSSAFAFWVGRSTIGAGTEAMRLTSTGLGIGTSSPGAKLNVAGAAGTSVNTILANGTTTGANFWRLTNTGGDGVLGVESSSPGGIVSSSSAYATVLYTVGATPLQLGTNSSIKATLDTSGNLGLGVTPSAWSGYKAFQFGQTGSVFANSSGFDVYYANNYYFGSGSDRYISSAPASYYRQLNGAHTWAISTDPTPTAGNPISFTQAMTLDASGNLLVGTTTDAGYRLQLNSTNRALLATTAGATASLPAMYLSDSTHSVDGVFTPESGQLRFGSFTGHPVVFVAGNTERARIPAAGGMVVGTAALATTATDGFLYVPTCAGTPTGTPTTQTGTAPIVVDTTNNKLYFYSGGQWRDAGP